jgi:hypothetical protein
MEIIAFVAFALHVVAWMLLPDGLARKSAPVSTKVSTAPAKA